MINRIIDIPTDTPRHLLLMRDVIPPALGIEADGTVTDTAHARLVAHLLHIHHHTVYHLVLVKDDTRITEVVEHRTAADVVQRRHRHLTAAQQHWFAGVSHQYRADLVVASKLRQRLDVLVDLLVEIGRASCRERV